MKTVRVHVSAGGGVEDARRAVEDVLEMLNRHFRARGVEFVAAGEGEGDWTIALYWKDFGEMGQEEFEGVYEGFKKERKPVIHVFFKEPDEGIGEALKAFKDAFATKYGHFYCRFETVDAVKFQLVAQSLPLLSGAGAKEMLKVEGGEVRLGEEAVAKLDNLPFAKLNAKRQSLLRQIDDAEAEEERLEEQTAEEPGDADLQVALRAVRVKLHGLKKELGQYDEFLCETAVFFAKESAKELDNRVRKARTFFDRGQFREANLLLDLPEMVARDRRDAEVFAQAREARIRNIQAFTAKAKLVMADAGTPMNRRTDIASAAYGHAVRIAREIRWEAEHWMPILFDHAVLLQGQRRFSASCELYEELLSIQRRLSASQPETHVPGMATTLNNLAILHNVTGQGATAENELEEALAIRRSLAAECPEVYAADVAQTLNNLAVVHKTANRFAEAERDHVEVLALYRKLAETNPEEHEKDVATALNNLGCLHAKTGNLAAAEREHVEAKRIRQRLAEADPDAYAPKLAQSLHNLANVHRDANFPGEAEQEYFAALALLLKLAETNRDAYEPELATAFNSLAILYIRTERWEEAENGLTAALAIQRRWAASCPEAHDPKLAQTLTNLASLHNANNQPEKAEREYREALSIYRRLAATRPEEAEHECRMTWVLLNLARFHALDGQMDKMNAEVEEARTLYARHPEGSSELEMWNQVRRAMESMNGGGGRRKGADEVPKKPSEAVRHYLETRDISHEYNAERNALVTGFSLKSKPKQLTVYFDFRDDGYVLFGVAPLGEGGDKLDEVQKYVDIINCGLMGGKFGLIRRDCEVLFEARVHAKRNGKMYGDDVEDSLRLVHGMFERFGDSFSDLATGASDVETESKKAMGAQD